MKDLKEIRSWITERSQSEKMVLCTLVRKRGSSYRGVGAKKVVSLAGESFGLLSGGCLEAAIEKTARERYASLPFIESFSTLSDEDRLFGYQAGCQGTIDLLFEAVSGSSDLDLYVPFGEVRRADAVRVQLEEPRLGVREFVDEPAARALQDSSCLIEPWTEPVQLIIVGCGADADPYVNLAHSLGWSARFLDFRSSMTAANRFVGAKAELVPIGQFAKAVPQGPRVAVVLMTHNYESDLEVLKEIQNHQIGYLGCIGPTARFAQLERDLRGMHDTEISSELRRVVHAPAGIFGHSQSPENIALSVVAQIQGELVEERATVTWTVVLAAGASQRFGGPKALAKWKGETLLARALQTAKEFSGPRVMVVTGGHAEALAPHLQQTLHVYNDIWDHGMGTSIAAGVKGVLAQDASVNEIVILPVDHPLVSVAHLQALTQASFSTGRCALSSEGNVLSPPAVVPQNHFNQALSLSGDRGLKSVLQASQIIAVDGHEALWDIDYPEDLQKPEPSTMAEGH